MVNGADGDTVRVPRDHQQVKPRLGSLATSLVVRRYMPGETPGIVKPRMQPPREIEPVEHQPPPHPKPPHAGLESYHQVLRPTQASTNRTNSSAFST